MGTGLHVVPRMEFVRTTVEPMEIPQVKLGTTITDKLYIELREIDDGRHTCIPRYPWATPDYGIKFGAVLQGPSLPNHAARPFLSAMM